jgi:hypothetical protein
LWQAIAAIVLKVPLDPNEGWNAYHVAAAMAGHGLYPDAASFMTNNYPPLSFYAAGVLGRAVGDNIVAGRILSLASFLFVCCGIAMLARKWNCSRGEALFAVLLFAAALLLFSDYVGMDDPQLFGHALQIGGLLLYWERRTGRAGILPASQMPAGSRRYQWMPTLLAAAFFVAGGFVKHNLAALPFATIVWLATRDGRRASRLGATMLAMAIGGLAVFRLSFGFDLLSRLASARTWSLSNLVLNLDQWIVWAGLPLAATLVLGLRCPRDGGAAFAAIYAVVGAMLGLAFSGGAGVDANAMFDADIAIALGAALAVSRLRAAPGGWPAASPWLAAALSVPFIAGLAVNFDPDWLDADFWLHPMQDEARLAEADIAWLKLRPGPVLCQTLALCYWAGKPAEVDVFNLDQQFETGARDEEPFLALLAAHRFSAIQLESIRPFPLPAIVREPMLAKYRIVRSNDDGVFLVPKS